MSGKSVEVAISVPRVLYEKLVRSRFNVESLIVERLINGSDLDPEEEVIGVVEGWCYYT